ncbi:uncharacterized protein N7482_005838 [Penicillium canariense]|uniref:Uncharacterized protein n=1 Tax=Penicillium canariense TaxID=189055 RepID=A0A9W9I8S4_9EURO|nr:uncharacterized protein N7482_005838 [Penicillium canariense]KAJ5167057.1 hypothetical protein N7482_005838 [Penicillium canariense]
MRPSLLLFVTTLLATYALGGGLAGALEKVFLWDCYQIAWEWQGTEQRYIPPLGKGRDLIVNHRGSGPGQMMTFGEFIGLITNKKTCEVAPPGPDRDGYLVALELEEAKYGQDVQVQRIDEN